MPDDSESSPARRRGGRRGQLQRFQRNRIQKNRRIQYNGMRAVVPRAARRLKARTQNNRRRSRTRSRSSARRARTRFARRRGRQDELVDAPPPPPEETVDETMMENGGEEGAVEGGEEGGDVPDWCNPIKPMGAWLNFRKMKIWCSDNGYTNFGPYGGVPTEEEAGGEEGAEGGVEGELELEEVDNALAEEDYPDEA